MSKTQDHFNSSLCNTSSTVFKWRIRAKVKLTLTNGGQHTRSWAGEAIIIKRTDIERVHAYAREHCSLRDFLIVHLPIEIGLRNTEIRTLRIENIDFESRSFDVLDSKKLELFPLPLDMLSLQLIKDLIGEVQEGYVFTHHGSWTHVKQGQPLSHVEIWQIVHDTAEKAEVKGVNPRLLRHYFAAHWIFDLKGSLVVLQRLLRHKNLAITTIYVSKLSFFEDIQKVYEGIQNSPLVPKQPSETGCDIFPSASSPMPVGEQRRSLGCGSICDDCSNLKFCKFAPLPPCASNCHYKTQKELVKNGV